MSLFLHGCLNLVFILFLRHGEGLSREPYCDSLFTYFESILFHRHWNMRKMLVILMIKITWTMLESLRLLSMKRA